jgi:hypothetical protein
MTKCHNAQYAHEESNWLQGRTLVANPRRSARKRVTIRMGWHFHREGMKMYSLHRGIVCQDINIFEDAEGLPAVGRLCRHTVL